MRHFIAALGLTFALSSCESDTTLPLPTGDLITLTATQAALIVQRVEQAASSDPTLSALADTIEFVVKAGAEAQRVDVTTSFGVQSYWSVSLHRAHAGLSQSWSTFHVIGFDDPSNPTEFLILGGFSQVSGGGSAPPTSVSGSIGSTATSSLTGHFFSVTGGQLAMWNASGGTSSLSVSASADACPGFSAPGMTCVKSTMTTTFAITNTVPASPATGQRTGSASGASILGIRLSM